MFNVIANIIDGAECLPHHPLQYAHSLLVPASDPYHKWELRWLCKSDTIPRYMRAAKWKMHDAQKRIKSTLEWRREYQPELIPPDQVSDMTCKCQYYSTENTPWPFQVKVECETGKMWAPFTSCYVFGLAVIRDTASLRDSTRTDAPLFTCALEGRIPKLALVS